jgi:hypothetical protein
VKTSHDKFSNKFMELLSEADSVDIAVGYISEKSLDYLAEHIYKNGGPNCNLTIGMHYFDKFTHSQFAIAKETEKFLKDNELGSVKLVTSFPFHGKLYSFSKNDGERVSIIGSSNMNNILPHNSARQYEVDLCIEDKNTNDEISSFIKSLMNVSPNLSDPSLNISEFKNVNNLLKGLVGVKKIENKKILAHIKAGILNDKTINIPLKTSETAKNSNLNACFGKGRENKRTKIVRSRPWYEVELIVPKKITNLSWYPKAGFPDNESIITVITDDGYEFKCKISGTNSKNLRSVGDLQILGKWLKGRLENAGSLQVGKYVTPEVLQDYGKQVIRMTPTKTQDIWYLDFGMNK